MPQRITDIDSDVEHRVPLKKNTLRVHRVTLTLFATYVAEQGFIEEGQIPEYFKNLSTDLSIWASIPWKYVVGFIRWQFEQGYAVGTVNQRSAVIHSYARRAYKMGLLSLENPDHLRLWSISSYTQEQEEQIDQPRPQTRKVPRAAPVLLSSEQAILLKWQPDTPVGRRDALLMCLLLDHGLRGREIVNLKVEDFLLPSGVPAASFKYIPQVQYRYSPQKMSVDTKRAFESYYLRDRILFAPPRQGPLFCTGQKDGSLRTLGWSTPGLSERLQSLGKMLGLDHLSPLDCYRYWEMVKEQNDPYARTGLANAGVKLSKDDKDD